MALQRTPRKGRGPTSLPPVRCHHTRMRAGPGIQRDAALPRWPPAWRHWPLRCWPAICRRPESRLPHPSPSRPAQRSSPHRRRPPPRSRIPLLPAPPPQPRSPARPPFRSSSLLAPSSSTRPRQGDTLPALALRFGVEARRSWRRSPCRRWTTSCRPGASDPQPVGGDDAGRRGAARQRVVYSPAAADFDVGALVAATTGYLSRYSETLEDETVLSGADIVQRVAEESSVTRGCCWPCSSSAPALCTASTGCRTRAPSPLGFSVPIAPACTRNCRWPARSCARGYYGWRQGTLTEPRPADGGTVRWNPTLNAGSVAVLHVFALLTGTDRWIDQVVGPRSFVTLYARCSGRRTGRSMRCCRRTSFSLRLSCPSPPARLEPDGRPTSRLDRRHARGALDLSPITAEYPRAVSFRWVIARRRASSPAPRTTPWRSIWTAMAATPPAGCYSTTTWPRRG